MNEDFKARLPFNSEIEPRLTQIINAFGFQQLKNNQMITSGFEDCNFIAETEKGKIIVKIYARSRTQEDIKRNILILEAVSQTDINHPHLYRTNLNKILFEDGSVKAVVMDYIDGKSFHNLNRQPTDEELKLVLREAVKISKLNIKPTFLYDSIAIVNLPDMFKRVKQFISKEDMKLLQPVISDFKSIPFDKLPKTFVHGDLISTNLILDSDGKIWVLDFSVANIYPKVQELAVITSSLLYESALPLKERIGRIINYYESEGSVLNEEEKEAIYPMALAAQAMELMGGYQYIFINKDNIEEAKHWQEVGRKGLMEALKYNS